MDDITVDRFEKILDGISVSVSFSQLIRGALCVFCLQKVSNLEYGFQRLVHLFFICA